VKYVDSTIQNIILQVILRLGKFGCLRLSCMSAAVLLLGLQVQIMQAWMLVSLFVCVCDRLFTHSGASYWVCVIVYDLENEAA